MREEIRVAREQQSRLQAASFDGTVPEGFVLYTVVTDREIGSIVDDDYAILGAPNERDRAALIEQLARLQQQLYRRIR